MTPAQQSVDITRCALQSPGSSVVEHDSFRDHRMFRCVASLTPLPQSTRAAGEANGGPKNTNDTVPIPRARPRSSAVRQEQMCQIRRSPTSQVILILNSESCQIEKALPNPIAVSSLAICEHPFTIRLSTTTRLSTKHRYIKL